MKKVRQKEYMLIKENLDKMKESGVINQEYYDNELSSYQIKKLNLSEALSYTGILLLIIGVMSFTWNYFEDIGSVGIILLGILSSIVVVFISYKIKDSNSRISRLLLYVNLAINFATILFASYNYNIFDYPNTIYLFFILAFTALPTIYYLESKLLCFMLLYSVIISSNSHYSYIAELIGLPFILYILLFICVAWIERNTRNLRNSKFIKFFTIVTILTFSYICLNYIDFIKSEYLTVLYVILGGVIHYGGTKYNDKMYSHIGLILIGIFGLILKDSYTISELLNAKKTTQIHEIISYFISLVYAIFFIFKASKGSFTALAFVFILILTLVDISAPILLLLGSLLLISSFLIERKKKGVKANADKQ